MDKMSEWITAVCTLSEQFLQLHLTEPGEALGHTPLTGAFSLHTNQSEPDLYGMIDAVYILYTLGRLSTLTTVASRAQWAERILHCQDEDGWFTRRNSRGHSREHATAYALGALGLLSHEANEKYIDLVKPIPSLLPILTDEKQFKHWITHLQFRYLPQDILHKNVGWHHIWRSSHIGAGVAAIIGMTSHLFKQWWPGQVNIDQWFSWYFGWLDDHASAKSGMWQRAFWNLVIRKPTLIDMGGAVHFYWVYEAMKRQFPYPEPVIPSTINLQRENGLYKDYPFCIDLDGNYCIIRAYLQLLPEKQRLWQEAVFQAAERNFVGVLRALLERPFTEIYNDLHGLPGALAALVECDKLPGFSYSPVLQSWQNPLEKVMWL